MDICKFAPVMQEVCWHLTESWEMKADNGQDSESSRIHLYLAFCGKSKL